MACDCYDCTYARVKADPQPNTVFDLRMARMFLCPTCGNKRCPRAKNHDNACSGSNAPGQKGSLYE